MPYEGSHIINKVFVEVNANSSKEAFKLKDDMAMFFQYQVFPKVEEYFNQVSAEYPDAVIQFDRLNLQLNNINLENRSSTINQIITQLKKEVDKKVKKSVYQKKQKEWVASRSESEWDAFFHFLKTGVKPWWQPNLSEVLVENNFKAWVSRKSFSEKFQKAMQSRVAQERLVSQFNDDVLMLFLGISKEQRTDIISKLSPIFKKDKVLRISFWTAIISHSKVKNTKALKASLMPIFNEFKDSEWLISMINSLTDADFKPDDFEQQGEDEPIFNSEYEEETNKDYHKEDKDGIYVDNAGLVLLHPFFKPFFVNVKLADSNGKIRASKMEAAIHCLHYMSTKIEQPLESELVLEKFLCGYPIHKPVGRFVPLSNEIKEMAETVLKSAISHWTVLKNTSPDGLRTAFLQREGKLILNGNAKLVVERKTHDVLLDKIPWNIHLIKLPWFDKIVFVEW